MWRGWNFTNKVLESADIMDRDYSKIPYGYYYLPFVIPVFMTLLIVGRTTTAKLAGEIKAVDDKIKSVRFSDIGDVVHAQRLRFAADHGVIDPAALVAAVKHSPMANLLISVAIEESRGDPVAIGSAGELGAWQVKPSDWGSVPKDIYGQAYQAERIIRSLLISTKGNKKKALALYNGGTMPPEKSFRYAERILKRVRHLQVAENFLPPKYN